MFFVLYTVYSLYKSSDLIQYPLHRCFQVQLTLLTAIVKLVPEEALRNSGAGSASAQSGHSGEMEMCLGIITSFTL